MRIRSVLLHSKCWYVVIAAALLSGCAGFYSATPLTSQEYANPTRNHPALIVFLPGIGDPAQNFEQHGFVKAAHQAFNADVITVDAHFSYYWGGSVVERLHDDVIVPALQRGYKDIWLVGVSLGGFGSLLYARAHPANIRGVFLIAPFLGNPQDDRVDPAEWLAARNGEDGFWEWLQGYAGASGNRPEIILVYGDQDKFVRVNRKLAELLPSENVDYLPGKHDWSTWKELWRHAIESNMLSEIEY
jgi:pimeloyl-ACP methyl ester carboxylesterase